MNVRCVVIMVVMGAASLAAKNSSLELAIREAMLQEKGTCCFIDSASGDAAVSDSAFAATRYTPCSTFKIWNTLIGAECGLIALPDDTFYRWDGVPRFLPAWNRNQTFREAFVVSCVPAFQNMARTIGNKSMKRWIDSISYGNRDISSGVDDFWLPREGKKSIMISPLEQAQLIRKLIRGELPFSESSRALLYEVMRFRTGSSGTAYGKTGSGTMMVESSKESAGWFVGYVTGKRGTYSFACFLYGENRSGKDAKSVVENVLVKAGLL